MLTSTPIKTEQAEKFKEANDQKDKISEQVGPTSKLAESSKPKKKDIMSILKPEKTSCLFRMH